ncbi:MAG: hypothetical protein ACJZ1R_00720 [Candidatus Neomarinimicrobiota bacterium]
MKHKTVMWREFPMIAGDQSYRINTADPAVAKRLRQRKDCIPAVYYCNISRWDYRTNKYSKKDAIKTLKRITRQEIKYDAVNDEYYADYGVIIDSNKRLETT